MFEHALDPPETAAREIGDLARRRGRDDKSRWRGQADTLGSGGGGEAEEGGAASSAAAKGRANFMVTALARPNCRGAEWKSGAGEGIRTLDPNLGKVVLYP